VNHFNLRDFTTIIVTAEGRPDEDKLFNQLKGLSARKLMKPLEHYGPKGALLFPENEIYRARLLLAALDLGVSSDNLTALDSAMRSENIEAMVMGGHIYRGLDHAIAGIESDERWVLELIRLRSHETGEIENSVYWIKNGMRPMDRVDVLNPPEDFYGYVTGPVEAVLSIPFSTIAKPIWQQFRKAG
jgi:hypothetical protein